MSADGCPRSFEAEAMRDGRLGDAERASFERHMKACSVCAREVKELELLAEKLRAAASGQGDELRSRRERTRLLAAFDRELLTPKLGGAVRPRLLGSAAALAVTVAVLLGWRVHQWKERPPHLEAAAPAVVHADPATAWSDGLDGDREVVTLDHGALSIRVDHATNARKLLVVLPDGELEDTGTTFTVSADNGRTTRVAVQEGSVLLRLRDQPPVALSAGEVWVPAAPRALASSTPPSSEPPSSTATTPPPLPIAAASAQPPRVPTSPEPAREASADFGGPMAALDRDDNRAAAEGFARFLRDHPGDARAEDAAYLRVIALQRCGDHDGVRAAGLEYLRRFPAGFRRSEVETLSR
jgi:hypothetical protein